MEMQMEMEQEPEKYSPLPWSLRDGGTGWLQIVDAQGRNIIDVNYSDGADDPELFPEGANAAFVLRAVNNHDALIDALQDTRSLLVGLRGATQVDVSLLGKLNRAITKIDAALSAAQEQSN